MPESTMTTHKSIQLGQNDLAILKAILANYPYKFYVYGSRAKGVASRYSDLDVFSPEKIEAIHLISLKCMLEESNLTIKVDILEAHNASAEFYQTISPDFIEL
jgi:uncharacterized protein